MKYAIVDGEKREALPGLIGKCPICEVVLVPKCGRFRVAHWAHPAGIVDHRWEPETEWHRNWKGCFSVECQEVIHLASTGERHIADVKTAHGRVLEFQHSPISEDERRSREAFYRPMHWIVDGLRLKRDRGTFFESLRYERVVNASPLTLVVPVNECAILQRWDDSRVLVFFDFGEIDDQNDKLRFRAPVLWASAPRSAKGNAVLMPVYRKTFLETVIKGEPLRGINFSKMFERARRLLMPQVISSWPYPRKPHPASFEHYLAKKRRARSWRRF